MSAAELEKVTKAWPPISRAVRVPHTEGDYRELVELLDGVSTKALNQALRRNRARFPQDFVFRLTAKEMAILRSQIVTSRLQGRESQEVGINRSQSVMSSQEHGGRRYLPYAFTEQGVAM